jgi:hypothetical protein
MNLLSNSFPSLLRPYAALGAPTRKPSRRSPTLSQSELRRLIAQMID